MENAAHTPKHCEHCGKTIKGRTDKRFCNDDCRNNFNRKKRKKRALEAPETIAEIIRIIKNNYQILLTNFDLEPDPNAASFMNSKQFQELGLNEKFYTSVLIENGELWKYCFDRGWSAGKTTVWVKRNPNQAEI
ncbi:uncharacterized protein with Zn-ribbon domain DUF2116 [Anseongella ginsenosidimutans]|uniref:Uncharacterized protein with Zn-ribbon domain DUF2116 n=1 Tax=Anseongella ginsenosidimutans TaxID=496056 RepID=A0A4R3KM12_9SPHI|nr:DUF2116 family Zn-ribbon domain-containing protein [Anseongella ginsenosidimutans]QEC53613.1 DUF2116 family Zn-ribbon domain-containing protein [Anseongella ginsenosidimutans]TCS83958.1 uncharacterized protein with Zn-ribbon domain DUF2116 [Anseongella ginsenosidimutans]